MPVKRRRHYFLAYEVVSSGSIISKGYRNFYRDSVQSDHHEAMKEALAKIGLDLGVPDREITVSSFNQIGETEDIEDG